jgi:hypothetical protein
MGCCGGVARRRSSLYRQSRRLAIAPPYVIIRQPNVRVLLSIPSHSESPTEHAPTTVSLIVTFFFHIGRRVMMMVEKHRLTHYFVLEQPYQ